VISLEEIAVGATLLVVLSLICGFLQAASEQLKEEDITELLIQGKSKKVN